MRKTTVIIVIFVSFFSFMFFSGEIFASPVRGISGDFWADNIIGKIDFSEITGNSVVSDKVYLIRGTIVDRTTATEKLYAYDSMNNRIMGINLNDCLDNATNPLNCSANIVIGQPSMNTSACNGDSGFQNFPNRAPASASSLCTEQESQLSISEGGSGSSMDIDDSGNLFVTDFWNNRVLKYISPFDTDQVADDIWGQANFVDNTCNQGLGSPTSSSLCFTWGNSNNWTAGVDLDSSGNLWVVDSGNNRVLRFPPGSKIADLVLGQADFTSNTSGSGLNKLNAPAAVRVNSSGRVYVADQGNNRVLIFNTPSTGVSGEVFGSGFLAPAGLDFDPTEVGIWVANSVNNTIELWSETLPTIKIKEIGVEGDGNVINNATGSIGINTAGDLFVGNYGGNYGKDILVYSKGSALDYPSNKIFGQDNNPNQIDLYGIGSGKGVTASEDQLQVLDENGRILFWNDLSSLTNGKIADGSIDAGIGSLGGLSTDDNQHLFVTIVKDADNLIQIQVYSLPLTEGAIPIYTIGTKVDAYNLSLPLLGGGSVLVSNYVWGLAPTSSSEFLWLSDTSYNRVLRIRNPLTSPVVDIILGQANSTGTLCNRTTLPEEAPVPGDVTDATLCKPGSVSLDRLGNLYVSDHSLEIQGNYRLLEFDNSLFPANNAEVLYGLSASKIFSNIATWQPVFSSQNKMVVGYNPYKNDNLEANPNGGWFPGVYEDPLSLELSLPDSHLNDYYSMAFSAAFDVNDNLYVGDLNRSRILVYKSPFNTSPTTNAGVDQTITLPNSVALLGVASDDGIPAFPGIITNWATVSGPGNVTFSDSSSLSTNASFSEGGSYVLRLTTSDGEFSVTDDVLITVNDEPRSSSSGGGGGGGGKITKPKIEIICNLGEKYSPMTGMLCTSFRTSNLPICIINSTLRVGSNGEEVKCLQSRLNIISDGKFGPKTRAAVVLFQKNSNLVPDGIFGIKSRTALQNKVLQ